MIACRAQFEIADGYTVPTELVLVPMLFLLPTPAVPLVVSVSWVLGRLLDYASGTTSVHRAFHVFGDCWHAVGPALVLIVAGAQVFSWNDGRVYAAGSAAPSSPSTSPRPRSAPGLIDGTPAGESLRLMAPGLRARRRPRPDRPAGRRRGDRDRARWSACS